MGTLRVIDLPTELICRIMAHIDVRDLYHCTLTCTLLRQIIKDSVELQFDMELGINRMVYTRPLGSEPSLSTRLELLRRRQTAWNFLQWKEKFTVRCPLGDSTLYEYLGGVYSQWGFDSLSFVSLQPRLDQEKAVSWTHSVPFPVIDYTSDPTQDLLVIITVSPPGSEFVYTAHIQSMATNEMHPKATVPTHQSLAFTQVDYTFGPSWATISAQIAGDFVAIMIRECEGLTCTYIEIWNWTQADLLHKCELIETTSIDDIHFLSLNTLLVTSARGGFVGIYNFDDPAVSNRGIITKAKFSLPDLVAGRQYTTLYASSYPLVTDSHVRHHNTALEEPLFKFSSEDRICTISIPSYETTTPLVRIRLFIHLRVFFGLDPHVCTFLKEHQGSLVPWEVWGPRNTRWCLKNWKSYAYASYGLKSIDAFPGPSDSTNDLPPRFARCRLRLRDFNPFATSGPEPAGDVSLEEWRKGRVIREPLCIPAGSFFAKDVVSYLPYREVITEEFFDLMEAIIDDNQIILKERDVGNGDKLTVLRF